MLRSDCSLPHRQLRKLNSERLKIDGSSLPHRQLRNFKVLNLFSTGSSLPHRQLRNGAASVITGFLITSLFAVSGFLFRNKLKDIDNRFKKIDDWHEKASIAQGEFTQVKSQLAAMHLDHVKILSQQAELLAAISEMRNSIIRNGNEERRKCD